MFVQILLGIAIIIKGIFHWINSDVFIGNRTKEMIKETQIKDFQRGFAIPHFIFGILLIAMGIIEEMNILSPSMFSITYVALAAIPLVLGIRNNKKYTGRYRL